MLDQFERRRLSRFGAAPLPIELEYDDRSAGGARDLRGAVELLIKGLTQKVLDFKGRRFSFSDVPWSSARVRSASADLVRRAPPDVPSARRARPQRSSPRPAPNDKTRLRWSAIGSHLAASSCLRPSYQPALGASCRWRH